MKSGIYSITNMCNSKIYIGQSVNVKRRLNDHKYLLKKGKHHNTYLQREFNKFGEDNFVFAIEVFCPIEELDLQERQLINNRDSMNRKRGYNLESGGNANKKFSEQLKETRRGNGNPMYGRKHSKDFVEKITLSNRGASDLFNKKDIEVMKLLFLEGKKQSEIAKVFGVELSTINKIINGVNWYWVREDLQIKIEQKIKTDKDIKMKTKRDERKRIDTSKKIIQERKENVRKDFLEGLTKDEIMKKHSISKTTYVRMTSDLYNQRKQMIIDKVFELKNIGLMNKDIAEKLGLHRTTVTEYLKNGS
ncbi:GIY-YIG nuclease family protein [Bacillus sp. A015]